MTDQDPITKLAMTPRSQVEAGIQHMEWRDTGVQSATLAVIIISVAIAAISLFALNA
jgi:hypothetical protein